MPDSRRVTDNMPWYATFITRVGVTAAICIGLVYWLVVVVNAKLDINGDKIDKVNISQELAAKDTAYLVMKVDRLEYVFIRICYNTGKTQAERNACLQ